MATTIVGHAATAGNHRPLPSGCTVLELQRFFSSERLTCNLFIYYIDPFANAQDAHQGEGLFDCGRVNSPKMPPDIDLDHFLRPLGDEQPCGPNLEYDADFLALEEAAKAQPEQEFTSSGSGDKVTIEGQGPDWASVRKLAEGLLERTRDLRVAVYYTRALLRLEGFVGIHAGLGLILGLLQQHWNHVHPELDAEDGNDPTMRVNALAPMVANDALISDLRASTLLQSRQSGILTVRNIEISQGKLTARNNEEVFAESRVLGMLAEALAQTPQLATAITDSIARVHALSSHLQDHVGASASLDFKPLLNTLQAVHHALGGIALPATEIAPDSASSAPVVHMRIAATTTMAIRSRDDVIDTIDRLVAYLEQAEPTNPAQWLLRRARRVISMNFLEAIVELAPDGLEQAERMVGSQLNPAEE